jgi:hypothetical protein
VKPAKLSSWDTYLREATKDGDRSIEFPLSEDECYTIPYPSRHRGRLIAKAQGRNDTDGLVRALLGDEAGERVLELSEGVPAFVLDELLLDVFRKFGMIEDDTKKDDTDDDTDSGGDIEESSEPAAANRRTNGVSVSPGKPKAAAKVVKPRAATTKTVTRKSSTTPRKSTGTSRRSSAA